MKDYSAPQVHRYGSLSILVQYGWEVAGWDLRWRRRPR